VTEGAVIKINQTQKLPCSLTDYFKNWTWADLSALEGPEKGKSRNASQRAYRRKLTPCLYLGC